VLCLTVVPALADTTLKTFVANTPGSPLHISQCSAELADTDVGNIDYYFRPRAEYKNVSARSIKALEIDFILMDGFDTKLMTKGGLDSTGLDAGSSDHGSWEWINFPQSTSEVKCIVDRVKFTDGTSWHNPNS